MEAATEIEYTLMASHDGDHFFKLGKPLRSKALVLAALNKTAYPPKYDSFKELKWVVARKVVTFTEEVFEL
jgi:hypothetical protein